jgi:crotonobetainyl-CoA:carnitine CoA-transferase CaiB-like acyl-CoA transferase
MKKEDQRALFKILGEVFLTRTLDEWRQRFNEVVYPWAPLQTLPEVTNDPQARANNFFVPLDHPTYGRMEVMTGPVDLSKTPVTMRMPAPESGQHTVEVLLELGYTGEDITRFREQGVIL